jgi:phosphoribosylformimino-5-aminoimidazole carboxamide ribotide isomerase
MQMEAQMILYPAIELLNGRCVSLFRGRLEEPQIWHVDPVKKAREFVEAGAEWIHVTDFDAINGDARNRDLIDEIIRVAGVPVQLGGGFRTMQSIEEGVDRGTGRIVVGTVALLQPELVKQAAHAFPDQIALAVDVYQGRVMSDGWRNASAYEPEEFLRTFENDPLSAIIVTDIDAGLEEAEDSLALISRLAKLVKTPVIARGLARSLDDVSRLKYVPHVSGAIISRVLFDRSVNIEQALAIAAEPLGARAEFV